MLHLSTIATFINIKVVSRSFAHSPTQVYLYQMKSIFLQNAPNLSSFVLLNSGSKGSEN